MFISGVLSIKGKLVRMAVITSSCALLLACTAFLMFDMMTFRQTLVRVLTSQAEIVGINAASALVSANPSSAGKTLAALQARASLDRAAIYDKDGAVFAQWRRDGLDTDQLPLVPPSIGTWSQYGPTFLEVFEPLELDGARIGTVYIRSNLSELRRQQSRYLAITFVVLFLSLLAAYLISYRLGGTISNPILNLARVASAVIEKKDYSVRVVNPSADEMGVLVHAFNDMLGRIEENEAELRRSRDGLDERVRERTRELEASNKELEAFSYSVSHDLRAPLRSIDGFSQAVIEDCGERIGAEGMASLRRVRAASQHMSQLIDDMINLARITRAPIAREETNLSDLSRAIIASLAEQHPDRRVSVDIAGGAVVMGDARLLRVALENLFSNAWKFTSKVADAKIVFGKRNLGGGSTAYFVQDNGAGFDMDFVNKLFLPFQRLHDAADFSGTGIGLAIVHRVITRHGGRVWAESSPGKGATFFFTL